MKFFSIKFYIGKSISIALDLLLNIPIFRRNYPFGHNWILDLSRTKELVINTIWDIGANVGGMTLNLNKYFPNTQIYAFEPVSRTYKILAEKTNRLKNIKPLPLALGNEDKELEIVLHTEHSINSLKRTNKTGTDQTEIIQVKKGDTLIESNVCRTPDFIKIDVEGFEIEVLDGLSLALDKIKAVYVEVGLNPSDKFHTYIKDILEYMEKRDFTLASFYEKGHNPSQKVVCWYSNLLFIKNQYIKAY